MGQIFTLFVGFGVVATGLIIFAYLYKLSEIRRARNWLTTAGRVVKSQVRNRQRTDMDGKSSFESEPYVAYEYMVAGKPFHSARINFAERIAGADVPKTLKRFPVGATVTVFYNPNDPRESVLERVMPETVGTGAGGLAAFILGAAIILPLIISMATRWLAPRIPNSERALLVVLTAGLGLALLIFVFFLWKQCSASRAWISVTGRVLSAKAEEYTEWVVDHTGERYRRMFRPLVVYMYFVDGQRYIRTRTHFGMQVSASLLGLMKSDLEKYPEDSEVTIYYAPQDPGESVIERRIAGAPLLVGFALTFLILAALASGLI